MRIVEVTCPYCHNNTKVDADSNFDYCELCGKMMKLNFNTNNQNTSVASLQLETTIITVTDNEEEKKIEEYRKMGWFLKNTEVMYSGGGSTSIRKEGVKLTFQRNKNHRNYHILNQYYQEYCNLQEQLDELYNDNKSGVNILSFLPGIFTIIISIVLYIFLRKNRIGDFDFTDWTDNLWVPALWFMISYFIAVTMLIALPYIQAYKYKKNVRKPFINMKTQEINLQINRLLNESERYI